MNVHHLELFYYVARHGGIMPAVRNIPYGIQQPAVSSQISQLEAYLGVTLFQRRPFALTDEGEKLFQFIQPFFSGLESIAVELQGGQARTLRIGASAIVLREHLPELFQSLRKKVPGLKVHLREGFAAQLEESLRRDEIDVAITTIDGKSATDLSTMTFLELPIVLLVERNSPLKSADDLWRRDKIEETLISLPQAEPITKHFQQKLVELGVDWYPGIETSSADLVETYVASGMGIGVSVAIPKKCSSPNVRMLPLPGFSPIVIGALWRGKKSPLVELFLREAQKRAVSLKE